MTDRDSRAKTARIVRCVVLALSGALLVVALNGCAAIGAAIGTGIGLATGQPEIALVTGPGGAWIGDKFAEGKREAKRADKAELDLQRERDIEAELRATLLANKAISEHNSGLPIGEAPTPLYGPPRPKPNTSPKSWWDVSLWKRLFGGGS